MISNKPGIMEKVNLEKLQSEYLSKNLRLLFLDYDGTLCEFCDIPNNAIPSKELMQTLESIASNKKNEIYIVSGRDRDFLDKHFGSVPNIHLIAEHGAFQRKHDNIWTQTFTQPLNFDWKYKSLPIFQKIKNKYPGTKIESKQHSLTFHYRSCSELIVQEALKELRENMESIITESDSRLVLADGNKIIELKRSEITKGNILKTIISEKNPGINIAVGDDTTDEHMFMTLADYNNSYSIKVGVDLLTCANYSIDNPSAVRKLLKLISKL